jgi:hypothetical protein
MEIMMTQSRVKMMTWHFTEYVVLFVWFCLEVSAAIGSLAPYIGIGVKITETKRMAVCEGPIRILVFSGAWLTDFDSFPLRNSLECKSVGCFLEEHPILNQSSSQLNFLPTHPTRSSRLIEMRVSTFHKVKKLWLVFIHIGRCTVHTISLHFKTVCTGRKIPTKDNNFVHFSSLHPPVLGLDIYHIKNGIYHLVMTNSLPWKITMLLSSVNHLFRLGPFLISISGWSTTSSHLHRPRWGEEAPWGRRSGVMAKLRPERSRWIQPWGKINGNIIELNIGFLRNLSDWYMIGILYDWCLNWYVIDMFEFVYCDSSR